MLSGWFVSAVALACAVVVFVVAVRVVVVVVSQPPSANGVHEHTAVFC